MSNLNINEISARAKEKEPFHAHGYKVVVFDVAEQTADEYKDATGREVFEADCDVQYDIYFIDECGDAEGW